MRQADNDLPLPHLHHMLRTNSELLKFASRKTGYHHVLNALRTFVGGWTAKILLILLVGSFALWGVSGSILGGADTNTVATIGETKISIREYLANYNRNMNRLQQQAGRRLTREEGKLFGIEQQTLSTIVSYGTMDEYARVQKMSISDAALAKAINQNPIFHDSSGKFNRDRFQRSVYEAQMRESDYIEAQKEASIRVQITNAIATGKMLPNAYKHAMGQFAQEERKFSYLTITPKIAGEPTAATDVQLTAYFEANKSTYKAPEYRKFVILAVEPKNIADEESITEEAVKADYDDRLQSYSKPEQRRVQQIVFQSQDAADKAVKSLSDGALFETVLEENKVKISDADLGLLAAKKLPEAIRKDAFSLKLNTPSAILKGPFGPTMIRVTEIVPENTTSLEEVKADIRRDLALRAAADSIISMQETIEDLRAGGSSIADAADKLNLKVRTIENLDRTARTPDGTIIKDIPESNKLIQQVFESEVGAQASPIDFGSAGYIWAEVLEITPTRDRKLDEVTEKVKTDWLAQERSKAVEKKAKELEERLKKGATLAELAIEFETEVKTTKLLNRSGTDGSFTGVAVASGFSGGPDHMAVVDGEKPEEKLLFKVVEVKRAEAQIVTIPEDQVEAANSGMADDLLNQMINNLHGKYAVTQNPTAINFALTQNR